LPERLVIGRADAVITVCDSIADELAKRYHIIRPHVVRNVPEYQPVWQPVDLHKRLNIADDVPLVIYQGAVTANRGLEQLIDAMVLLDRIAFIVLGDGPLLGFIRRLVYQRDLDNRVHLLGRVPLADLPSYTAGADIGVSLIQNACLSYYYCLPNKLFEYLHAGLPVVVSNFPEMGRVVRQFNVGELANPADPAEIAAAIRRILDDPACYGRRGLNARTAAAHFTWALEARQLLQVYRQLDKGG
jgi:glycosyltransferase involved in cell wall biosynthesis